jgi:TolB-like protein
METNTRESYRFGEFELDLVRGGLYRRKNPVRLRPKSFDVLKYLVQHNGRLVTKKEVMHVVWADSFVTDDSLVQCLIDVRRALGARSAKYIKTVQRRGYIFDGEVRDDLPDQAKGLYLKWPIAVLPFKHLASRRNEFFELGMVDALITRLSNLRQLSPRPTSVIRQYMNTSEDPLKLGKKLGVKAVLTGNVQCADGKFRVTAQLLGIPDGNLIWADKFDEQFTDVFSMQDSVCNRIAAALESLVIGRDSDFILN